MATTRVLWPSWVILFLGFWLVVTPQALGSPSHSILLSDTVSGIALFILGWLGRSPTRSWPAWTAVGVALWLQAAPLLFWAPDVASYCNDTLVSALVIVFAILVPGTPGQPDASKPLLPPGWSYNPSSWPQRMPIVLLACVGWFISRYLAAYQLGYIHEVWDPFFSHGTLDVITSSVSRAFPVSDAGLGAMAYTLEALLACKGDTRRWCTMPWMVVVFGLLVVPLGLTSVILIILQPLVVGAWCTLCLITAFCMLIMIALAVDEVVAVCQLLKRTPRATFWKVFWKGTLPSRATPDRRTPPSYAPLPKLLRAMTWGVTLPWNLFCSALIGAGLMIGPALFALRCPLADTDHLAGALIIVVSVLSCAEVLRPCRWLNIPLGLWVLFCALRCHPSADPLLYHLALSLALILLACRRGPLRETYGVSARSGHSRAKPGAARE